MIEKLDVQGLIRKSKRLLGLTPISGKKGLNREITTFELQRPGLAIGGYTEHFAEKRIQIIGQYEMHFIESLPKPMLKKNFEVLFSFPIPCLIFAKNLVPPDVVIELADKHNIPILSTRHSTYQLMSELGDFLEYQFAPNIVLHGVMVDVYGVGLLIRGKAGIGKSECALDLVARGHRLVADDYVVITKRNDDVLIANAKEHMGHFMEIRGIGIIDIEKLFGIHSVRMQKRVELEVRLMPWDALEDYERIGEEYNYTEILGIQIPLVTLPISPGKDISTLTEVIAMNFMLHVYGENPAKTFLDRIEAGMKRKQLLKEYLQSDPE
ncbi:MAG: HPr(Ser) kinase/phosphatase [Candidatus Zixiibacteriota bacterium]